MESVEGDPSSQPLNLSSANCKLHVQLVWILQKQWTVVPLCRAESGVARLLGVALAGDGDGLLMANISRICDYPLNTSIGDITTTDTHFLTSHILHLASWTPPSIDIFTMKKKSRLSIYNWAKTYFLCLTVARTELKIIFTKLWAPEW